MPSPLDFRVPSSVPAVETFFAWAGRIAVAICSCIAAYDIRLYAVRNFGKVIHEFDPWFNYRAAEYLAEHGASKFFTWFDHSAWYPLGRPVGTTIYPGMQFVAVWIWQCLKAIGVEMSLHDVCVYMPAWFGVATTLFLGLLTWEGTGDVDAATCALVIMAILPAHIMRSVAGGFDNECVAIAAMCSTFYFWCRALRAPGSWPWGAVAGFAYFSMVASWGGYIYVLNLIGFHCVVVMLGGRYSSKLHRAYSVFFVIGTALAVQIPVVGMTPLRSLEQMGPMAVFFGLQVIEACAVYSRHRGLTRQASLELRLRVFLVCGAVLAVLAAVLFQAGYFGPISSRVRGLFLQHTKTGNPLVDSVAEHQATSPRAYWQYLYYTCYLGPLGFVMSLRNVNEAKVFLLLYAGVTYYFSAKMNRLVLLLGPAAASLGGAGSAFILKWAVGELMDLLEEHEEEPPAPAQKAAKPGNSGRGSQPSSNSKSTVKSEESLSGDLQTEIVEPLKQVYKEAYLARKVLATVTLLGGAWCMVNFWIYCQHMAEAMSNPTIMTRLKLKDGRTIVVDDYREAYWWLRDNTPEDSRVMAWWDYGYQINGIANRTTIADGNTWNHEHIATLGRCLTNSEEKAHDAIRHLADYVLVWAGGGGDDLAKSPHMARIANSVYSDVCPGDPKCRSFGFKQGVPSKMMAESLLFKLHGHGQKEGVTVNPDLFQEAYTSSHNLVRIFKVMNISEESKAWAADPENWVCDAPGSWFCKGQYPPALDPLFKGMKAFQQLEDFNARHQ